MKIHDAGDTVVVELVGTGANDGPLGPLPATGKRATLPIWEIDHFGRDGRWRPAPPRTGTSRRARLE